MFDPGHGGEDTGAIGKYHNREKDVVLQIARRRRALIEKRGQHKSAYDRNEDVLFRFGRVAKAQKAKRADLFVFDSRRCLYQPTAAEAHRFCPVDQRATSTAAKFLCAKNAPDLIGGHKSLRHHTMFDMVQSPTIADSLKFGKAVLQKMGKNQ